MKYYVADFETTTTEPTRVWAWGVTEIGKTHKFTYDNTIDTFFEWIKGVHKKEENKVIYFHNLKFDMAWIFDYLFTHGYRYSNEKLDNTFNCLIADTGEAFQIEVIFKAYNRKYHKVTFLDSYKKLPYSEKRLAESFNLPPKLEIDYHLPRVEGYEPTEEEILYLKRDVEIVAMALDIQIKQGLNKMTVSSDALTDFKKRFNDGNKFKFRNFFPIIDPSYDKDIRQAYKGGFTYLKDGLSGEMLDKGMVYDVNSMYPAVLKENMLPYGAPVFFKGKYEYDEMYPLHIQMFRVEFTLKENHLPTIQLKGNMRFQDTEYIKETGVKPVILTLTNIDLDLFYEHYEDIEVHEWIGGYKFKCCKGLFDEYVDYWMNVKNTSEGAQRELAKLMLNSLYGKFGSRCFVKGKFPFLNSDGIIRYETTEEKEKKPIYTPLAIFTTSYARDKMIRTAQDNYDRFIYCDTDSLHIQGEKEATIDIHPKRLGAWKFEYAFTKGKYIKAKLYMVQVENKIKIKGAGLTEDTKKYIIWDNFKVCNPKMLLPARDGYFIGKKQQAYVRGGIILKETVFTINE